MEDLNVGLGARIMQAARLAVHLHLQQQSLHEEAGLAQRISVGGADRDIVTEDTLSPAGSNIPREEDWIASMLAGGAE